MRKQGGTPARRDKHVTLAAISPPGVAQGRFVGGQQSGLAGCKTPPLFVTGATPEGTMGRLSTTECTYLPTYLPTRVGMARARRVVPVQGAGRAVSRIRAPPRVLPRSRALSCLLGGGGPVPFPPCLACGCVPPFGRARASRGVLAPGGRGGGGAACVPFSPEAWPGGAEEGGPSTQDPPSAFPGPAPKRLLLALLSSWRAWPPYCSDSCSRFDPGCGPCGALVCWHHSACLSRSLWEQAGGGVGAHSVLA